MKELNFKIPEPSQRYESIDDEIFSDIEFVSKRHFAKLYVSERYKCRRHCIDILVPKLDYAEKSLLLKNADYVRFPLSLYPEKSDLLMINRIILRPRHIEADHIELMSVFLRSKKTLVLYLFAPHSYDILNSSAAAYNEFLSFDSARMVNRANGADRNSDMLMPPLLYIMSMLGHSGNEVDKFFLRSQGSENDRVLSELDEISDFYRRHGY